MRFVYDGPGVGEVYAGQGRFVWLLPKPQQEAGAACRLRRLPVTTTIHGDPGDLATSSGIIIILITCDFIFIFIYI